MVEQCLLLHESALTAAGKLEAKAKDWRWDTGEPSPGSGVHVKTNYSGRLTKVRSIPHSSLPRPKVLPKKDRTKFPQTLLARMEAKVAAKVMTRNPADIACP